MKSLNRRQILGSTIGGFFGLAMRNQFDQLFATSPRYASGKVTSHTKPAAKRCLVLWMNGGPSQLETFDPKPGKSTGGEFKSISTAAADIQICETLPEIAKQMGSLSVIRNLTSKEGAHERAQYYLHSGFKFNPAFPRPSLGSVVSQESAYADFPKYVSIGSPGFGPAFMGPEHAPFSIEDAGEAKAILGNLKRHRSRLQFLNDLGSDFDRTHETTSLLQRKQIVSKIQSLSATGFVDALDVEVESKETLSRYGDSEFSRQCLLARRMLELGVSFVEVQMDGWDTHTDNFNQVRRLCSAVDRPWAALMQDLKSSGLLDETIVIWMGEFGRTPTINGSSGRDHFPHATPVVLGGGPFQGGKIIGRTNELGTRIEGDSHSVADLFATIYTALGVDLNQEFTTEFDSPTTVTDSGSPIQELFD